MTNHTEPERTDLPSRKVVYIPYSGLNTGMGQGIRTLYAWVGTYYKDRVSDVTVCFDERPTQQTIKDRERHVEAEGRFDLDEYIPIDTKLPHGLVIKEVASESIITRAFKGPLPEIVPQSIDWLADMVERHDVAPGYRQRFIKMAKKPTDTDWEIEVQLVLR